MRSQFLEALRIFIVSAETAACLGVAALYFVNPIPLAALGLKIQTLEELWRYMLGIPVAAVIWSIAEAKSVLFPASATQNRKLHDWPHYWRLKMRVVLALVWVGTAALVALYIWIYQSDLLSDTIGALLSGALAISLISGSSLLLAAVRVREIVEE